jgi:hypothetical protein
MHTVVGAHDLGIVLGLDQLRQRAVASRLRLDDDCGWPNPSHEFLPADQLSRALYQGDQDVECATPDAHRLAVFKQLSL